jgi:hypothetical protein
MSAIKSTDPDFRIAEIDLAKLEELQLQAEERGFATRWSSVDALRLQVGDGRVLLQSMLREEREGSIRAYRCLALFPTASRPPAGGMATIDIDPSAYLALQRMDHDHDVRAALVRVLLMASGGIEMVTKA